MSSSTNASFGLKFHACDRDDPIEKCRGYLRPEVAHLYKKDVRGTLLNLRDRAFYLNEIATRPCAAPDLFQNLGLTFAADKLREAIDMITACWEMLPCAAEDISYLISKDSANILFATVYSFTAVLNTDLTREVIETVTIALLLSPLFTIHIMALRNADGSPRQVHVNLLSTISEFSQAISEFSKDLVLHTETKNCHRMAHLLENVLYIVQRLLEESKMWFATFRWFNISGVQHVLALRESNLTASECLLRVMTSLEFVSEEGVGEIIDRFTTVLEMAVSSVVSVVSILLSPTIV